MLNKLPESGIRRCFERNYSDCAKHSNAFDGNANNSHVFPINLSSFFSTISTWTLPKIDVFLNCVYFIFNLFTRNFSTNSLERSEPRDVTFCFWNGFPGDSKRNSTSVSLSFILKSYIRLFFFSYINIFTFSFNWKLFS